MKNALESLENTADHMEERISKLEDRKLEIIQREEERELRSKNIQKFHDNYLTLLGSATL